MTDRQSESYKKVLLLGSGIFLSLWLLLMFAGRSKLLRDPGTFSHLVIGQRILSTGHFIYNDPFSFTFSGKPWIAQQWLGECLMAVIHRIGGFDSLLLVTVTLLASLYTWLILRLVGKGMHPMLAVLIIAMAMAASSFHFHVRPHLVTIIFSAVLFAVLTDFESGQIRLSRLFWLIPLFALWVNIHGGVLGGMATLTITGTGWILIRLVKKSPPLLTFQQIFILILLILACLSTAFVNPYGHSPPQDLVFDYGFTLTAPGDSGTCPSLFLRVFLCRPALCTSLFYLPFRHAAGMAQDYLANPGCLVLSGPDEGSTRPFVCCVRRYCHWGYVPLISVG